MVNAPVSKPVPLSYRFAINVANHVAGVDKAVKNALEDAKAGHTADVSGYSASQSV